VSTNPAIRRAVHSLQSIAPALPRFDAMRQELSDTEAASKRGYFNPEEDDRVRRVFSKYLTARAALFTTLRDLEPLVVRGSKRLEGPERIQAFTVAFCTACMLVRSGRFVVDSFSGEKVVWRKLDEAAPRFGIPRKQFTSVYRSLTRLRNVLIFQEGIRFYESHREEIEKLREDAELGSVVDMLEAEIPFVQPDPAYYSGKIIRYRIHSFLRRQQSGLRAVTFSLFKLSGSVVAEIRNQWRGKRVTPRVRKRLEGLLQAGDVIVTRHDDALSNLFLPGFWPHGALYIGSAEERDALGVQSTEDRRCRSAEPIRVLEARKDGVLFRPLDDTFQVDACTIIRPRLSAEQRRDAISRAMEHEGKLYDFEFDFTRDDKLVCTEVIYRAYHGIGPVQFNLTERTGRFCLSAEDLLDHAVDGSAFEVIAVYGARGNRLVTGDRAVEALRRSYRDR